MTDKFQIRSAYTHDAQQIRHLMMQLGYQNNEQDLIDALSDAKRSDRLYVCANGDIVVAVMALIAFDYFPSLSRICCITAVVVDEQSRGLQLGSRLIKFAKQWAQDNHCDSLEVTTSLARQRTQAYYQKLGFEKQAYRFVMPV